MRTTKDMSEYIAWKTAGEGASALTEELVETIFGMGTVEVWEGGSGYGVADELIQPAG